MFSIKELTIGFLFALAVGSAAIFIALVVAG
jgi:hypothetical protein